MIHAVSLGEINATKALVQSLARARPDLHFVISVTTDTGHERGTQLYGNDPRVTLIRYPLDFSWAINRVLDTLHPRAIVLMELEVWPNFMLQCEKRGIPVVLVNGRLTPGSFRNYGLGGFLVRKMFRRLSAIAAQEQIYSNRFISLGASSDRVSVTGTMKFDTAQIADRIEEDEILAAEVGLRPGQELIWVCGSTGPGEELILLNVCRQLLETHPTLRLVIVPRKPERFDEVAELIQSQGFDLVRRSRPNLKSEISNLNRPIILGDTMGELRKFYSLADVVFVGRTLVDLGSRQHGSDMIEPAALAKPVIVGTFTANFAEVMNAFRAASAMYEVRNPEELRTRLDELLSNPDLRRSIGQSAQSIVRRSQGATGRNAEIILKHLTTRSSSREIWEGEAPAEP